MNIYTGYFGKSKKYPAEIVQISICASPPKAYKGLEYKILAPKYRIFMEWKDTHNSNRYIQCFNSEVLGPLDPKSVYADLERMSGGKDIVLLCYEKPEDFCHRHIVADWLGKSVGAEIKELVV